MEINDILEALASDNSRLAKEAILEQNKDNAMLRETFRLALDPFTQFYIRKIPDYHVNQYHLGDNLDWALDQLISMLSSRKVTGNAAIDHLKYVLENVNAGNAKVIEKVIRRDLRCGVSTATVNKIWENLVHEYPVMLCSQFEQKLVDKIKYPAIVQTKMDGMRFNAIVTNGACEFRSRNGKEVDLLGHLQDAFIELADGKDVVFDGELIVRKDDAVLDRKTGNGILNKAVKGTITLDEAKLVCATLWDMIPYEDFVMGKCDKKYRDRFNDLVDLSFPDCVDLVDYTYVDSFDAAQCIFEELLNKGEEGIILKDLNGIWEDKRAKHQIKFKGELECDLRIVGVQAGTGKYSGMLGALILRSECNNLEVNVGSGFNDEQRKKLVNEKLIDKIVAVKYNARIKDKNSNKESLFLPIFVEIREDKDTADQLKDIK